MSRIKLAFIGFCFLRLMTPLPQTSLGVCCILKTNSSYTLTVAQICVFGRSDTFPEVL
jgi:hypothetical protein